MPSYLHSPQRPFPKPYVLSHLFLQIFEIISYLLINVFHFKRSYICLGSRYNKNKILIVIHMTMFWEFAKTSTWKDDKLGVVKCYVDKKMTHVWIHLCIFETHTIFHIILQRPFIFNLKHVLKSQWLELKVCYIWFSWHFNLWWYP